MWTIYNIDLEFVAGTIELNSEDWNKLEEICLNGEVIAYIGATDGDSYFEALSYLEEELLKEIFNL